MSLTPLEEKSLEKSYFISEPQVAKQILPDAVSIGEQSRASSAQSLGNCRHAISLVNLGLRHFRDWDSTEYTLAYILQFK